MNFSTFNSGGLDINLDVWNSMSKQDQDTFIEVGADWGTGYYAQTMHEKESVVIEEWRTVHGV